MVRIINGEVVPDDDPRAVQQRQRQQSATVAAGNNGNSRQQSQQSPQHQQQAYFQGQGGRQQQGHAEMGQAQQGHAGNAGNPNPFGLPDVTLFGVTIKPQAYIIAGIIVYMLGPQSIFVLIAVFALYKFANNRRGVGGGLLGFAGGANHRNTAHRTNAQQGTGTAPASRRGGGIRTLFDQ